MSDWNTIFQTVLARMVDFYRPAQRNRGLPYITHPLEVMSNVTSMQEKVLALLHDYLEIGTADELSTLGVPDELIAQARLLAKTFGRDKTENDTEYQEYIWNLLGDPVCCRIKYFDLLTNGGYEEYPTACDGRATATQYSHVVALLGDAVEGKLYFKNKSFMVNIFSNFFPVELDINGEIWKSAEHFYQAAKFCKPYGVCEDAAVWESIRNAGTAGVAKQIADANFSEYCRQIWNQAARKFASTAVVLNAKFAQGTEARHLLQKTGNLCLIHEAKDDMFWGQSRNGEGMNILGKVLMQMREDNSDCSIVNLICMASEGYKRT